MAKNDDNKKVDTSRVLEIEGTKYSTNFHRKYETKGKWVAANPKEMLAFIPGTVTQVNVKPGQKVKHGDLLVIFEAMKMLNRIVAPFDGVVKEVKAKTGEKVAKGFVMLEFE